MKPGLESLIADLPEVDENLLKEHYERLGENYFQKFTVEDVKSHIYSISRLSPANPVEVKVVRTRDNTIGCTVIACDYPSEFSLITGLLSGSGFNILSGDVYTYGKSSIKENSPGRKKRARVSLSKDFKGRRKIVDFFSGDIEKNIPLKDWTIDFKSKLNNIVSSLEEGSENSIKEAKNIVNEMVVRHLENVSKESTPVLYPVELTIDNDSSEFTRLKVVSEDTPAFLYALSNALALHEVQIDHVRIRTFHGRVEDIIDLLDSNGNKIEDRETLDRIKFSVLLTKQFTYFLSKAPDPYTALARFEVIIKDILKQPFREEWLRHMTNPRNLQDLARLLGTSDFLWEDFIRLQYESLMTVFHTSDEKESLSTPIEKLTENLNNELAGMKNIEEKKHAVNRFKDQEIFLIDLDHILDPSLDFRFLAEKLTDLAELVINKSASIIYEDLIQRYGTPKSVAGLDVGYAIMGLGKLGSEALGYASDIELLFIYSDNGKTEGRESITNSEFFNLMVKGLHQFIDTKREGIFQIDLRLRPHGNSGPLACSMESYCQYYGREGQAHSFEILSLVRMRFIGGDKKLGRRLERIRDEIVYLSNNIDFKSIRDLREKQFKEKIISGRLNAKYSPGGLVDLEYGVQTLQVMYGKKAKEIRTARIHSALKALKDNGYLTYEDHDRLTEAYSFLRELINGLRMLRGSALDLFLPEVNTSEFEHLARRMGYRPKGAMTPSQQLYLDLETHMAGVRVFAEKYFGLDSLPSLDKGTIVDIVLSDNMPADLRDSILSGGGIKDPKRAFINLQNLAGKGGSRREIFGRLSVLAWDIIKRTPDPDMALNNWERFIHSKVSPEFHFNVLLAQPMQLEILLKIFSSSQFLSDTMVRYPGFFDWLINPDLLHRTRKRDDLESELRKAAESCKSRKEWLNKLRRFRRREILRIGVRDIYLNISTRTIMHELSVLAEACTQIVLEESIRRNFDDSISGINPVEYFAVIAFGKLGGNELNYSSDIDLIGLYATDNDKSGNEIRREISTRLVEDIRSDLSSHTEEGYAYRVDLRLRPFGSSGDLVQSIDAICDYYKKSASFWEIQAAIKMRPVAGNIQLGYDLITRLKPYINRDWSHKEIAFEIDKMRNKSIKNISRGLTSGIDVKSGIGGIRDIEFLVQGLQLLYFFKKDLLIEGNTLLAIESITESGILPETVSLSLKEDYIFLRRVEHYLQILEDRQIHTLPAEKEEIEALAKRMLGIESNSGEFMERLNECLKRVRSIYDEFMMKYID